MQSQSYEDVNMSRFKFFYMRQETLMLSGRLFHCFAAWYEKACNICDVSRRSLFTWRGAVCVKRQAQRDCLEKKNTTMPDRCVASNHHNVVDLSKCIFGHNIPIFYA